VHHRRSGRKDPACGVCDVSILGGARGKDRLGGTGSPAADRGSLRRRPNAIVIFDTLEVSLPEQPTYCSRQNGALLVQQAVLPARYSSATHLYTEAGRTRTCNQTVMSGRSLSLRFVEVVPDAKLVRLVKRDPTWLAPIVRNTACRECESAHDGLDRDISKSEAPSALKHGRQRHAVPTDL
jgi:hypothetical protein